jgi:CubicO group peptidase (beta-lactamase class C family)
MEVQFLMFHRIVTVLVTLVALTASAAPLRLDPERLQRLDRAIEREIAAGKLPGAVVLVRQSGEEVVHRAYGMSDVESRKPMATDAVFRIASMSKLVTTVGALMLYEEGRFLLSDPISKFLPEFSNLAVAVPGDAPGTFRTVPVKREPTIRDLMRHTSGYDYGLGIAASSFREFGLTGWYLAGRNETIADAVKQMAQLPLVTQPGEVWTYGYSTDILGRLIEVVANQPLDVFLRERLFEPLGMVDTSFFASADQARRLAVVHAYADGKLSRGDQGHYVDGPRKCFSGGAGLLSTAADYSRFLDMLLRDGRAGDKVILGAPTVALLRSNHTGDLFNRQTHAFGLGVWFNDRPGAARGELWGDKSFGGGGAYYTSYFVDRKNELYAIFMAQVLPRGTSDFHDRFVVLIEQALVAESDPAVGKRN